MSLLKYIERLKRMDDLIKRKATGNARDFAAKLKISESQLFQDLKEMKQLGAPIEYCAHRESYQYDGDYRLILAFTNQSTLKGGCEDFFAKKVTPELLEWHPLTFRG
jgi:hypothetical protein